MAESVYKAWHHSPSHLFVPGGCYIVTAATKGKRPIFGDPERLGLVQSTLLASAEKFGWHLEAWCVLANHYHFVATAPDDVGSLKRMIQRLHSRTALTVNALDAAPGRRVWFQYWDTCLTHEKSYLVRLSYVHNNAVKHGIVTSADEYPYCSARWFAARASPAFHKLVMSLRTNRIDVVDDF